MVTIIIPISRIDYLDELFRSLENLDCDSSEVNLLTYVDGDQRLFEKARNLTVASKFKDRLCVYRGKGQANVGSITRRRQRISDIHNEIKTKLERFYSDYFFLIEDDTIVPPHGLKILLEDYQQYPKAGFISGLEVGRWGYLHIGAWLVDDVVETRTLTSIGDVNGLTEVDAAGLYCCLIKAGNYLPHVFKPFDRILGPDVDFGLTLGIKGLENYVDGRVKCVHLNKKERIYFNRELVRVQFSRSDRYKTGWEMKVL